MPLEIDIGYEEEGRKVTIKVDPNKKIKDSISDLLSYWGFEDNIILSMDGKKLNPNQRWIDVGTEEGDLISVKPKKNQNYLPEQIWRSRIENEIISLPKRYIEISNEIIGEEEIEVKMLLTGTPGPIKIGSQIALAYEHSILLKISRSYPYTRPVLKWKDDIFHPNILPRDEGGSIKIKYLNNWCFSDNIKSLIENIRSVLMNPEIENVWDSKICNDALEHYLSKGFPKPRTV